MSASSPSAPTLEHPFLDEVLVLIHKGGTEAYRFVAVELQAALVRAEQLEGLANLHLLINNLATLAAVLHQTHQSPQAAEMLLDELVKPLADNLLARAARAGEAEVNRAAELQRNVERQKRALSDPLGPLAGLTPSGAGGMALRKKR